MSKNQPGLGPAVGLDSEISFVTQTQNGRCCLNSFSLGKVVGLTGLEPVTLRLSSACSNQLSYRPGSKSIGYTFCAGHLWWRHGDSNPRPIACKATALPTELCPQGIRDFISAARCTGN